MTVRGVLCPINNLPANHYATKGRAEYYIEPVDGIIFQAQLPSVSEMEAFNQQEYESGNYRDYIEAEQLKKQTGRLRLNHIEKYAGVGGRLLDIGCSAGFFLEVAQERGFEVHGVELSSHAINKAKSGIGEKIFHADANEHVREHGPIYDLVTAFDVIEHTQNPISFLSDVYSALKPGGVVAITTPDTDHFLRYLMGRYWSMLQPMQHTFLLSKRSTKTLLQQAGFSDIVFFPVKKTLTIKYLLGQLSQTNPAITWFFDRFGWLIPSSIGDRAMDMDIGEFLAIARKPSVSGVKPS